MKYSLGCRDCKFSVWRSLLIAKAERKGGTILWKLSRKRRRMLIQLGVDPDKVKLASRSRKGYWRLSNNSLVRAALKDDFLKTQGVPLMRNLWVIFKFGDRAHLA